MHQTIEMLVISHNILMYLIYFPSEMKAANGWRNNLALTDAQIEWAAAFSFCNIIVTALWWLMFDHGNKIKPKLK